MAGEVRRRLLLPHATIPGGEVQASYVGIPPGSCESAPADLSWVYNRTRGGDQIIVIAPPTADWHADFVFSVQHLYGPSDHAASRNAWGHPDADFCSFTPAFCAAKRPAGMNQLMGGTSAAPIKTRSAIPARFTRHLSGEVGSEYDLTSDGRRIAASIFFLCGHRRPTPRAAAQTRLTGLSKVTPML